MLMKDIQKTESKALFFDATSASIQGGRDYQQDALISNFPIGQLHGFAIVADGMGGHSSGEVASALAVSEVYSHLKMNAAEVETGSSTLPLILRESADFANQRLAAFSKHSEDEDGMGTTLLVAIINGHQLNWLSIGDSPLFLFRDNALRRLNKDHSMAPQIDAMILVGSMDPEKGRNHPDRNALTSVLAGDTIKKIDCPASSMTLLPGDILIVASDGLQSLSNARLANSLAQNTNKPSDEIASALLVGLEDLAVPDQDNASFVVLKVGQDFPDLTSMNAEDMPVLAMAGDDDSAKDTFAESPLRSDAQPQKKKKTFFYRGREYEKED